MIVETICSIAAVFSASAAVFSAISAHRSANASSRSFAFEQITHFAKVLNEATKIVDKNGFDDFRKPKQDEDCILLYHHLIVSANLYFSIIRYLHENSFTTANLEHLQQLLKDMLTQNNKRDFYVMSYMVSGHCFIKEKRESLLSEGFFMKEPGWQEEDYKKIVDIGIRIHS